MGLLWTQEHQTAHIRESICHTCGLDNQIRDFSCDQPWPGSDEHDLHVHSAAISAGMDTIITFDQGFDLGPTVMDQYCYAVDHPDTFLCRTVKNTPGLLLEVTKEQMRYYLGKNQEFDLPKALRNSNCPAFAELVVRMLRHSALLPSALKESSRPANRGD